MSVDSIKELREATGCGIMDCKKALATAGGDLKKAKELIRERGLEMAKKKSSRDAKEGRIEVYIHNGNKIGVMVEVNCETDFVARNEEFVAFAKGLAMHIAAMNPQFVTKDQIKEGVVPEDVEEAQFVKEMVLMEQPFVKDSSKSIQDMLNDLIAKMGENILIGRFERIQVGA